MKKLLPSVLFVVTLAAGLALHANAPLLPASPYEPIIDGNPREAFLLGAHPLDQFDAVTGAPDGRVRAYLLAVPDGLYVAELSTEPSGPSSLVPAGGDDILAGDWMGVRVTTDKTRVFCLGPGRTAACLGPDGVRTTLHAAAWASMDRFFGHTWAGEWLIPWKVLGVKPGETFKVSVLRGRKAASGAARLEVLNTSASGPSACRFGNAGPAFRRPAGILPAGRQPKALAPFDVRPYVPHHDRRRIAKSVAPAGQIATAWLVVPPQHGPVRIYVEGAPGAKVFRVDFWWQAGVREEQDALLPARAVHGAGDVLVAERLFPQPSRGFAATHLPLRIYIRWRVPASARPGTLPLKIRLLNGGQESVVPWSIRVTPPLPRKRPLAGAYYFETDPSRWKTDFADLAAHGIEAVTCPVRSSHAWKRFQKEAKAAGLDGAFALHPEEVGPQKGAWGCAADEPTGPERLSSAGKRIAALKSKGFKTWAALAWPDSTGLARNLDAAAFSLNLACCGSVPQGRPHWIYFQALRENPIYNRLWAGIVSGIAGSNGFWAFCYAPPKDPPPDDWALPLLRYDALTVPDGHGGRLDTVEFEALREGIVDGRILAALGPAEAKQVLAKFPLLEEAAKGRYWEAAARGIDFQALRKAAAKAATGEPSTVSR